MLYLSVRLFSNFQENDVDTVTRHGSVAGFCPTFLSLFFFLRSVSMRVTPGASLDLIYNAAICSATV